MKALIEEQFKYFYPRNFSPGLDPRSGIFQKNEGQ